MRAVADRPAPVTPWPSTDRVADVIDSDIAQAGRPQHLRETLRPGPFLEWRCRYFGEFDQVAL